MAGPAATPEELTAAQAEELHQRLRTDREEIEAQLESSREDARQFAVDQGFEAFTGPVLNQDGCLA